MVLWTRSVSFNQTCVGRYGFVWQLQSVNCTSMGFQETWQMIGTPDDEKKKKVANSKPSRVKKVAKPVVKKLAKKTVPVKKVAKSPAK